MLNRRVTFRAQTDGTTRQATLLGRDYTIVPVVALVEGVVQGLTAEAPELALAEEFGRTPVSWNGRPVVMNHPIVNGSPVSANSPEALTSYYMGFIFNATIEDKKLKVDAWLDTARIEELGGEFATTLARIQEGKVVEISTGLFTGVEKTSGRYNTKEYAGIWRNVVPDHLALLSEGTVGACSIEDGCGTPRTNQLRINATELAWSSSAFPSTTGDCGCGCGGKCKEKAVPTDNTNSNPATGGDVDDIGTPIIANGALIIDKVTEHENKIRANIYPNTIIDSDVRMLVRKALKEVLRNDTSMSNSYVYMVGFTKDKVIYERWDYNTDSSEYWQRSFSISAQNVVTFGDDAEQVNLMMQITPVTTATTPTLNSTSASMSEGDGHGNEPGDNSMPDTKDTPATPPAPTPSANTQPATTSTPVPAAEPTPATPATPAVAANTAPAPTPPRQLSVNEYIQQAPAELQGVLQEGLKLHNAKREGIIKALKSTNRCTFDDAQLSVMTLDVLESLAQLAQVPVYNGQHPAPTPITDNAGQVPQMPALIPPKQSTAA